MTSFRILLAAIVPIFAPAYAMAQMAVPLLSNGQVAGRINMVIIADGYTAAELGVFAQDANAALQGFLAKDPFTSYKNLLNVWRIDVASNESGIGENGIPKNTAVRGFLNCTGIARYYCVDSTLADTIVQSVLPDIAANLRVVIGNTNTYGGGGGSWAAATRGAGAEVFTHELGHSFGLLRDEYVDPQSCGLFPPPSDVNTTAANSRTTSPWQVWINPSTSIPTTSSVPGVPGLYQGADYCNEYFRPTEESLMRTLGQPFYQINEEQLVKRMRSIAMPLIAAAPSSTAITVRNGQLERFTAIASVGAGNPISELPITWRLDGSVVTTGLVYLLDPQTLSPGAHILTASARDPSSKVLNDPNGFMQRTVTFTLSKLTDPAPLVQTMSAVAPTARSIAPNSTGTAFAAVVASGPDLAINCQLALTGPPASNISNFTWRETSPSTNQPVGPVNPLFSLRPDVPKTFVITFTPTTTFSGLEYFVVADCANTLQSKRFPGVNGLTLTASSPALGDVIAIAVTGGLSPGIIDLPADGSTAFFVVAGVNIGPTTNGVHVVGDTAPNPLPVVTTICQTNPRDGTCLQPPSPSVTVDFPTNETKTFTVFLDGRGTVPFDPAAWRTSVHFWSGSPASNAQILGSSGLAMRTQGQ